MNKRSAISRAAKAPIYRLLDRHLGGYVQGYMYRNVYLGAKRGTDALRKYNEVHCRYSTVRQWPENVKSFENLALLFHSGQSNYGICLLTFEEAAYLYSLVKGMGNSRIAEIGRSKGGSTFLIATAMGNGSTLESYDIDNQFDHELNNALERYHNLASRINIITQDSTTVKPPESRYDLVFIDGDHSYKGAKADFMAWRNAVKTDGHLLFHDAARTQKLTSASSGVIELVEEIESTYDHQFERVGTTGSLVHFRKKDDSHWKKCLA